MAVHVVTDSTADLTPELIKEFGVTSPVHIVPLTIHFGEEEYRDGVDLSTEEFYRKLRESHQMPRTSQPSPAAFIDVYSQVSQPGETILSFHISSKLSGTYQSALLAARQFDDRRIEVVDTRSASLGVGLIALRAAELAERGAEPDEILILCREMINHSRVFFLVDTLEYLQKNGRIGKAQAIVGGLLNVKPILTLEDGVVAPLDKVRGKAKARARLLERLIEGTSPDSVAAGAVVHAQAPEEADSLTQAVAAQFPTSRIVTGQLGPTVGTHVGPGTLGVVAFER